jgi:Cep192 domain 4/Abnormal spindle-like microcephaly-assoc'd, ASPM-SPD-2-Hydin/HYDIN/CFA65/VesB-like, Ig-like domain
MEGQIAITPSSVAFGNVLVGNSQTQTVSIANVGSSNVSMSQVSVTGNGYAASGLTLPYTLSPGQSVYVNVTFTPPATGTDGGALSVSATMPSGKGSKKWKYSSTTTSVTAALSGTGITAMGQIAASPTNLSFGSVLPGSSQTLMESLTNTGNVSVTISGAGLSSSAFTLGGLSLPATLGAGQSLTFSVVFGPTASGSISGTLTILSNASDAQLNVALTGTGATAGQLTLTPTALNFGNVIDGSNAALSGTLTASGSSVTVSSATSTSTEFVMSGISFPKTLSPGQSMPFTVTFLPQVSGTTTASLSFSSNAGSSPVMALSGSGVAPQQHSVSLSWTPSSTTGVVGYNVYRGTVSGGPYAQVGSNDVGLTYTDNGVSSGQTYYYVVTAVGSAGTESTYSNQAQAVVPSP